jgi:hypothetical protein
MTYLRLWLRGFILVALVAANTRQIAAGDYFGAFLVGGCISFVWWANSSKDRPDAKGAGAAYAFGAACGTVAGMWLCR